MEAFSLASTPERFAHFVRCCWRAVQQMGLTPRAILTLPLTVPQQRVIVSTLSLDDVNRDQEAEFVRKCNFVFALHVMYWRLGDAAKVRL
jgi:hypothetical protein